MVFVVLWLFMMNMTLIVIYMTSTMVRETRKFDSLSSGQFTESTVITLADWYHYLSTESPAIP